MVSTTQDIDDRDFAMTPNRIERKQIIVTISSVLLASFSYFIPIPSQITHRPPQTEQAAAAFDKVSAESLYGLEILLVSDLDQGRASVRPADRLTDRHCTSAVSFITLAVGIDGLWGDELNLMAKRVLFPSLVLNPTTCYQLNPPEQVGQPGLCCKISLF